jgi:formylglycine-generating enzyme required for sulfatase activity
MLKEFCSMFLVRSVHGPVLAIIWSVLCVETFGAQPSLGKYALMIAVTKYDHAAMNGREPLKFPEEDAKALGALLKGHDYEVEYLLGPAATREAILAKLESLNTKGNSGGICVVGIFGHGVEMKFQSTGGKADVQGCFCPFDTAVRQALDDDGKKLFEDTGAPKVEPNPESLVKMSDVVNSLALAKAGSRMLIADCCREMPNRPRGRNLGLGANFNTDRLPGQTAMLFGCRPGERALERDDWKHGAFTKALLEELVTMTAGSDPVTSGTLADRVKRRVQRLTNNEQNPTPISLDSIDLMLKYSNARSIASNRDMKALSANKANPTMPAETVIRNSIDMPFVRIPSGEFLIGSPENEPDRFQDETQHRVAVSKPFMMGMTEVTQAQYQAIMNTNPSSSKQPQHPVENISWLDAVSFCQALSALPEEREARRVYRLPTEAEWEYACRGDTATAFHFGDESSEIGDYAWYKGNTTGGTSFAVKQKKPNAWGLYDMHGNVNEWCSDWYGEYETADAVDPKGAISGAERVLRGGSYNDTSKLLRSASRMSYPEGSAFPYVGFRVVLEVR